MCSQASQEDFRKMGVRRGVSHPCAHPFCGFFLRLNRPYRKITIREYNTAMREWRLTREQLPRLTLAADARLSHPNYLDDQIWELSLREGEPAGMVLQTNFGLRARSMRLFPRFTEGDDSRHDPDAFHAPPVIHRFYPNFALTSFSPFDGIDVVAEYWVAASNVVCGRLRVINSGVTPRSTKLNWIALLVPGAEGQPMTPAKMNLTHVLQGRVGDLVTVLFLSGGSEASHSPYPSLNLAIDLLPGLERQFVWVHAAAGDAAAAFELARAHSAKNFEAEITRIILTTHDLAQARRVADDVVFIHRGRLVEQAPAETFFERPREALARAFVRGELLWWDGDDEEDRARLAARDDPRMLH